MPHDLQGKVIQDIKQDIKYIFLIQKVGIVHCISALGSDLHTFYSPALTMSGPEASAFDVVHHIPSHSLAISA